MTTLTTRDLHTFINLQHGYGIQNAVAAVEILGMIHELDQLETTPTVQLCETQTSTVRASGWIVYIFTKLAKQSRSSLEMCVSEGLLDAALNLLRFDICHLLHFDIWLIRPLLTFCDITSRPKNPKENNDFPTKTKDSPRKTK